MNYVELVDCKDFIFVKSVYCSYGWSQGVGAYGAKFSDLTNEIPGGGRGWGWGWGGGRHLD